MKYSEQQIEDLINKENVFGEGVQYLSRTALNDVMQAAFLSWVESGKKRRTRSIKALSFWKRLFNLYKESDFLFD